MQDKKIVELTLIVETDDHPDEVCSRLISIYGKESIVLIKNVSPSWRDHLAKTLDPDH